jgi:hypothetical protein
MFFLPISFLPYQEGDEEILFEDSLSTPAKLSIKGISDRLYPIQPLPAKDFAKVGFALTNAGEITLSVRGADGRLLFQPEKNRFHLPGFHTRNLDLRNLAPGLYWLEFSNLSGRQTERIVIEP